MLSIDPSKQQEFAALQLQGKQLAAEGKLTESLLKFEQAKKICPTPKVLQRIEKLKSFMKSAGLVPEGCCFSERQPEEVKYDQDYSNAEKINFPSSSAPSIPKTSDSTSKASTGLMKKEKNYIPELNSKEVEGYSDGEKANCSSKFTQDIPEKSPEFYEYDEIERKLSKVRVLYEEARALAADGKLNEALEELLKAQSIHNTEKVLKKINQIKEFLKNDTESNDRVNVAGDFSLYHKIYNSLYPYQREGVAWLWNLHKRRKGGILADDMGLGKTFQVIAFLSGLIDEDLVKHVLIIMPVSLLTNWEREFQKWCPGISVHEFHGTSKKIRERNLMRAQKRGHVLLTSYGMILKNVDVLSNLEGREFVWDYVILDEGHKIKNASKTTKAVYEIPSMHRIVLTGTPIQNNLKELWSLFDFVHQGTLLGSLKTFKNQYENPIIRSREKDATSGEKRLGAEMSESLKRLINPYFIRRTKKEIWGGNNSKEVTDLENQMEGLTISMPKKNDLIMWTFMSDAQIDIYKSFLHSNAVKEILMSKRSPLVELTVLKKICDHPRLLSQRACSQLGLGDELLNEDILDDESSMAPSIDGVSDEMLLLESGKLKLVIALLEHLKESGHRTLFFSLSRKILDMVQRILLNRKFKVMRVDGTISKTEERERRIQRFQNDASYSVFLLTTQVGGVGINLTAADRVIIYDPSWNPATDAQAVDRVFRIGQSKNVVIYRLITCGSVEEKIYRRQIFKDSITRQTTSDADPYRYFSKQDLRELFSLEDPHYSVTQAQLHEMHSDQRRTDEALTKHIEFLKTLNIFGISDHDLMFTKEVQDQTEDNDENAVSENFIKQRVAAANDLILKEATVTAEGIRIAGTFNRPYQLTVPLYRKAKNKELYKPPVFPEEIDLTENDNKEYKNTPLIIYSEKEHRKYVKILGSNEKQSDDEIIELTSEDEDPKTHLKNEEQSDGEITELPSKDQGNLETQFEIEDFRENSYNSQLNGTCIKRLSCARQSRVFSPDIDNTPSDIDDSSNSASLSFVPDSASNTPQKLENKVKSAQSVQSVHETPPSVPKLFVGNTTLDSFGRKQEGNVRGITPLKVNRSLTQDDASFKQALASSIIVSPKSSPQRGQDISIDLENQSLVSEDSPVHNPRRVRGRPLIASDSEESEDESELVSNHSRSSKRGYSLVQAVPSSITNTPDSSQKDNRQQQSKNPIHPGLRKIASDSESASESEDENDVTSELSNSHKENTFQKARPSSVINSPNSSYQESRYVHVDDQNSILNKSSICTSRGEVIESDSEDESDSAESEDGNKTVPKFSNSPSSTRNSSYKKSQFVQVKEQSLVSNESPSRGKVNEIVSDSEDSFNSEGSEDESDSVESEDEDNINLKLSRSPKENTVPQAMPSSVINVSHSSAKEQSFASNESPAHFNRKKVREVASSSEESDSTSDSGESENERKIVSKNIKSKKGSYRSSNPGGMRTSEHLITTSNQSHVMNEDDGEWSETSGSLFTEESEEEESS